MSTVLKYRPEIDGLRAVAVLAVIFFHAEVPGFSGGFVGVDIFFVISGYLIAGILLRELSSDSFSIVSFYERRVRRILPALFIVLLACIVFGWFILGPSDFSKLGQGLMATVAFVSNIFFRHTTNYFNATLDNPLLHTWSLGVEEQFYIFFPILLCLIWRRAQTRIWFWMIFAVLLSLGVSQALLSRGHLLASFYLSPSRAFELLLGSLVALAEFERRIPRLAASVEVGFGWLGFGMMAWAVTGFDQTTPFPGVYALVPSVGAALVLVFVRDRGWPSRLLSSKGMVGIGLVSYSAYLWHQPVFSFARLSGLRPDLLERLGFAGVSLLLAWLSWRYVERPFRDRLRVSRDMIFRWAIIGSLLVFAGGAGLYASQGVPARFTSEELKWWKYTDIDRQSEYVIGRFNSLKGDFTEEGVRKVLVLGDSYAQDFVNMLHEQDRWKTAQIRTVYIPVICQMTLVEEDISEFVLPVDRATCDNGNSLRSSASLLQKADVIILAANWAEWAARRLPETIENLHLRPDQRLIVVGAKEFGSVNIPKLLALGDIGRARQRHEVRAKRLEINTILKRELSPDVFVDQIHIVCGSEARCPIVTDRGDLISYDGGHLTRAGAEHIGKKIFSESPLAAMR